MVEEVAFADLVLRARQLVESATATGTETGQATGTRRVILGITGSPGAGKSTLAQALHHELADVSALTSMDGFHLSNTVLEAAGTLSRKGAPDTFDVAGFVNLLARLQSQTEEIVYAPEFNRSLEESIGSAVPIRCNTPLVIIEGNYLLHTADDWHKVASFLTETWFVSPPDQLRKQRLINRHEAFGRSPDDAKKWALGTDQANADLVGGTKARATRIIYVPTIPSTTQSTPAMQEAKQESRVTP